MLGPWTHSFLDLDGLRVWGNDWVFKSIWWCSFTNCVVESESLWEFGAWEGGRRGGGGGQWEIQAGAAAAAGQSGLAGSAGRPPGIGEDEGDNDDDEDSKPSDFQGYGATFG